MIPKPKRAVDVHFHYALGMDEAAADVHLDQVLKRHPWDRIVGSCLNVASEFPSLREVHEQNDLGIKAMGKFAGAYFALCYLNATHGAAACLAELDRCLDAGMVGVKLWVSQFADDPRVDPIAARCTELRIPILAHAGGNGPRGTEPHPRESKPAQVAALSNRHPKALIYMAHVGTEWEYGARALEAAPNLMVDLGGSYTEAGTTERLLKYSDITRILLATDNMSYPACLAKATGAGISGEALEQVAWKNANRLFHFWPNEL